MDEILHAPKGSGREREAFTPAAARRLEQGKEALRGAGMVLRQTGKTLQHRLDEATAGGRRLVSPVNFFAAAAVVGVIAVVSTVYTPSYAVSMDGIPLGTVRSPEAFEEVVDRVEARAGRILGREYTLGGEASYEFALSERGKLSDEKELEEYLFNQISEVELNYVLKVDGKLIGAAADQSSLERMLEEIKAPYVTEHTTASGFTANVAISHEYTPTDVNQDLEDMFSQLTVNTNGQTTYEVVKGDTFMQIALDNGMTVREMQELNPDINIDRIYIGQLLNIREEIPFLSVQTVEHVTYQEPIECPVEQVKDDSMYQGESRVIEAGVPGEARVTADVTYLNGKEQEREILESETLSAPTTRVIAVGTKERPSWFPNGYFIWPVYGRITSSFGYRSIFGSYSYHGGIDIATSYGVGIAAADGGTVTFAGRATGYNWSYGNLVIVDHGNGKQTYYGHCSSVLVSAGDHVYQGQTIARVGSTGRSTGNHCHFEVKIGGTSVNPLAYLS